MTFGDITVTLRPIRFAFLVNPSERKVLDGAIRIGLLLWGGLHDPIILILRRVPTNWFRLRTRRLPASDICKGYICTFDPYAVVLFGGVDKTIARTMFGTLSPSMNLSANSANATREERIAWWRSAA